MGAVGTAMGAVGSNPHAEKTTASTCDMFIKPAGIGQGNTFVISVKSLKVFCPWEGGDSFTVVGGESHDITPAALTVFNATITFHSHIILGFSGKTGDSSVLVSRIGFNSVPIAGGNLNTHYHIINIKHILVIRSEFPADVLGTGGNGCTVAVPLCVRGGDYTTEAEVSKIISRSTGTDHKGFRIRGIGILIIEFQFCAFRNARQFWRNEVLRGSGGIIETKCRRFRMAILTIDSGIGVAIHK